MNGKLVIISAPSGAGKTTIVKHLLESGLNLSFSISATSRKIRGNETDGEDYFFLTVEEFKKKIENNEFVEWEEVYKGHFYGTLKSELARIWANGNHVLFDVDVKGAISLKNKFGTKAIAIFVMPPSVEELENRLNKRGTDTPEKIRIRIEKANEELKLADQFDKIIVNHQLDRAKVEAKENSVIISFKIMARIGLYFGSFNPVHIGHMAIAGYMTEFGGLDQVWFVVSPHNPLKNKETLLADHHRLYMTQLAIGDSDKLKSSDIEFKLPVPSYTIDTLTYLKEKYSHHEFCLVMGEDNISTLHKWKNVMELVEKYPIYVYPRPGSKRPSSLLLDQILAKAEIHKVNAPLMDISGTFIREGIRKGKDMSYFLPPEVWKYIKEMHFYEK